MMRRAFDLMVYVLIFVCAAAAARADDDPIKRGEYLARAGDCVACHTAPGGKPFAGGRRIDTPYGPIYSPNITPDKTTGIGAWSDDEFYRALHEGLGRNREYLYPVFPFPWYTNVTRDDALAIKAYLFSLPPVEARNKPAAFSFPFDIREGLAAWRALFFKAGTPQAPAPGDKLGRGKYLVEGLGHCGECHNHNVTLGASDWSGRYQGGAVQGWYAPNLTADGREGIGAWSEDELATFLKSGVSPGHGIALGPMQETIQDSLSHLTDDDLHAIAAYLKSIPAKQTYADDEGAYAHKGAPGEDVYLAHCASCHRVDGKGRQGQIPALAGNGAVMAGGPDNVLSVVLGGLPAARGFGPMPAVGASMSDQEIAQVTDYVRNAFGNAAPIGVDPEKIAQLRKQTSTPMAPAKVTDCAPIASPQVQAMLDSGGVDELAHVKPVDRIAAIDAALAKLKGTPGASADLAAAYCRVMAKQAPAQAAREIGDFAVLTYARAVAANAPL